MMSLNLRGALFITGVLAMAAIASYALPRQLGAESQPDPRSIATLQDGGDICYHTFPSDRVCPDSMSYRPFPEADILSASLTVTTPRGTRTIPLPRGVDAVFLTRESTEKFLLPYYFSNNRAKALALLRIIDPLR